MKHGDEHIITSVQNDRDEMRLTVVGAINALAPGGNLVVEITNRFSEGEKSRSSIQMNHDTARVLFGLLGQYLHAWEGD